MKRKELARMIDHTNLKPNARKADIERLCAEAREHGFISVCVNPSWIGFCARLLKGSSVIVCSVVGFPLGATASKAHEASLAVKDGAGEIDMVIDVGRLLDGDVDYVRKDIAGVVKSSGNAPVKVIFEVCYLTPEQIRAACKLAEDAGAAFVKTSTGFGPSGATVESVRVMRGCVGQRLGVKAAGGIRDYRTALAMVGAGASRIGASASVEILREAEP